MSNDKHVEDLGEAGRRAGSIVTEHIDAIIASAERRAEEIRREGERDAEAKRRAAIASAQVLLERINALERPLGELVVSIRGEMDRLAGELESGDHVDAQATAIPAELESTDAEVDSALQAELDAAPPDNASVPEPEANGSTASETEPATPDPEPDAEAEIEAEAEPPVEVDSAAVADSAEDPDAGPPSIPVTFPSEQPTDSSGKSRRSRRSRRGPKRDKKGVFISREGHCAVCQRTFMAGSTENLEASGWRVSGDVGLCPDCQGEGWQLPDGARLPFRRGGS